jgi:tripeptidyl-peptidase I
MRVLVPSFLALGLCLSLSQPEAIASPTGTELDKLTLRQTVTPPHGWTRLGRAPGTHVLQLRIALPQPHFPELERLLAEISDPSHPSYGEHLSKEAAEELVAPDPSSLDTVRAWLAGHGIQWEGEDCRRSPAGDWVTVHVPVALAEKMLSTVSPCSTRTTSLPDWGEHLIRNSACGGTTGTAISSFAR